MCIFYKNLIYSNICTKTGLESLNELLLYFILIKFMFQTQIVLENTESEKVDSMKSYTYQVLTNQPSDGLYIGNFHKKGIIAPDSFAQLTWFPKTGLELTMWSYDKSPLIKREIDNDPVNEDRCLACFINVFPRYRYKGYISVEISANGLCHCFTGAA